MSIVFVSDEERPSRQVGMNFIHLMMPHSIDLVMPHSIHLVMPHSIDLMMF